MGNGPFIGDCPLPCLITRGYNIYSNNCRVRSFSDFINLALLQKKHSLMSLMYTYIPFYSPVVHDLSSFHIFPHYMWEICPLLSRGKHSHPPFVHGSRKKQKKLDLTNGLENDPLLKLNYRVNHL